MRRLYLLLRSGFIFSISLGIFYLLEYGFDFNSLDKLLVPFLLSTITMIMLFKPNFKRYILFLVGMSFVLMILAYVFNLVNFSNIIGSFGFSLLIVTIFLYLPQIIKKGYVERF